MMPSKRSPQYAAQVKISGTRANSGNAARAGQGVDCDGVPTKWTKKSKDVTPPCIIAVALRRFSQPNIDAAWAAHEERSCSCPPLPDPSDQT